MAFFKRDIPTDKIADLVERAEELGDEQQYEKAWEVTKPLRKAQGHQLEAAEALAHLLEQGVFGIERGLELAGLLFDAYGDEAWAAAIIGHSAEALHDMRYLNAAPPDAPILVSVAKRLEEMLPTLAGTDDELGALKGLSTLARVLGRTWDEVAERACQRLTELSPDSWAHQYNLGLLYKTRGRFAEGQAANQRAVELGAGENQGVVWNLGICATGAGDAETALATWKGLGQTIEMGRFGLPEGGYPSAKVRLVERPLATRGADDVTQSPGLEETIWIERLSPCHGVVRSALYYDLGVDYGDVIMFDGAPITHHTYGEDEVPVFPHLVTLPTDRYRIFEFAGTQEHEGQIDSLSEQLTEDAIVYVHTEQFQILCSTCWENSAMDHAEHSGEEHHIVTGKICAPPTMTESALIGELDKALESAPKLRLFIPDLARAVGDDARADVEQRRMSMICDSL